MGYDLLGSRSDGSEAFWMPWDNLHLWPLVSFQGEILKEFLIHKQTNKSQRQKKGRQQYYPGYRNEVDDHNI
jgi:hypothetical protein